MNGRVLTPAERTLSGALNSLIWELTNAPIIGDPHSRKQKIAERLAEGIGDLVAEKVGAEIRLRLSERKG